MSSAERIPRSIAFFPTAYLERSVVPKAHWDLATTTALCFCFHDPSTSQSSGRCPPMPKTRTISAVTPSMAASIFSSLWGVKAWEKKRISTPSPASGIKASADFSKRSEARKSSTESCDPSTAANPSGFCVSTLLARLPRITFPPKTTHTPARPLPATEKASARFLGASLFVSNSARCDPVMTTGLFNPFSIKDKKAAV